MKIKISLLIMIAFLFSLNFCYAQNDNFTIQIINLAMGLAKISYNNNDGGSYLIREIQLDSVLQNSIDLLRSKADNSRNIITLKKSDIKPIVDYIFDSAVKGEKNSKKIYIQSNGTNSEKYVVIDTNKKIYKTKIGNFFISSIGNKIYFDSIDSDFYTSDSTRRLNYTNYNNDDFLKSKLFSIVKKSENTYLNINNNREYRITNSNLNIENIHNADFPDETVTILSSSFGTSDLNSDVISGYEIDDFKNALIFEAPQLSYNNLQNAIDSIFTNSTKSIEFRLLNTIDFESTPSDFFNDDSEGKQYEKFLTLNKKNNNQENNTGNILNLDWLKNLIDTIVSTTQNIYDIITNIPIKLEGIYNIIKSMFDVSQFTLDLSPLKVNFMERFPFCIPSDFLKGIKTFNISMSKPDFKINIDTEYIKINQTIDIGMLDYVRGFFRYVAVAWYSIFLIMRTRDMIKW